MSFVVLLSIFMQHWVHQVCIVWMWMLSLRRCYNKMYIDVSAFVLFPSVTHNNVIKVSHVIKVSQQHLLFTGPYFYLHQKLQPPHCHKYLSVHMTCHMYFLISNLKKHMLFYFLLIKIFCHSHSSLSLLPGVRTHVFARTLLFETCWTYTHTFSHCLLLLLQSIL